VKHFNQYLYSREFTLVIDHCPLCKLFGRADGVRSLAAAHMQRWAMILSAYSYKIEYILGPANQCANSLSCLPLCNPSSRRGKCCPRLHTTTPPVTATKIANYTSKHKYCPCMYSIILGHFLCQKTSAPFIVRKTTLPCKMGVCCGVKG